jgi:amino acid transporter
VNDDPASLPEPPGKHISDPDAEPDPLDRARRIVIGPPRDLTDRSIFHRLALIPVLAWIGLGADGLSSSSYGPDEAFRTLGQHGYLALGLAAMTALTVFIISAAYSRIIEVFPNGGGYMVASALLGKRVGVVSGSALLIDYVLTITVSLAAATDALFSFLPLGLHAWKVPACVVLIFALTVMNLRGIKESILALTPIFVVFVVTHLVLVVGGIALHIPDVAATARAVHADFQSGLATMGGWGLLALLVRAYSMGGGTYTGIEAVSNGLPIIREPRVQNGQRTMLYMAWSLSFMAAGLLVCYLLWQVAPVEGKTMNAALLERFAGRGIGGQVFTVVTLISEGALLVVAAQAGFIAGPRVLANMAVDSWVPRSFSSLSERLTTQNGVFVIALSALALILYSHADVRFLVVMYSINVFLTFALSTFGMLRATIASRSAGRPWKRRALLFAASFALCATVLGITTVLKFPEGGWLTIVVTSLVVAFCFLVRRHYEKVSAKLGELYRELEDLPIDADANPGEPDPDQPTAAILVARYGGLGIHTFLNVFRAFPAHFKGAVFVSVGVVSSSDFKEENPAAAVLARTEESLGRYVALARGLGIPATYRVAEGTDAVDEAERLVLSVLHEFPRTTVFAGKVIFGRERWYQRLLHNETALSLQKRLQWRGHMMVVVPARM